MSAIGEFLSNHLTSEAIGQRLSVVTQAGINAEWLSQAATNYDQQPNLNQNFDFNLGALASASASSGASLDQQPNSNGYVGFDTERVNESRNTVNNVYADIERDQVNVNLT